MARLRYDNAVGTLGASLTSTGTTITFASAPSFATITGSDYVPLILEPTSGTSPSANFEVVYLTAYTSGATTGTISRGQEGTSGIAHSSGVAWTCGPTVADLTTLNALPAGAAYQQGVINSGDLAASSISINSGTGAITMTLAGANQFIVKDTSGLLVPVTISAQTYTFTPPTLPTSGNSIVQGLEVDVNGALHAVSGSSVSGNLSTASTIETNTPATTSGRVRIWDVGVYNSSGTYQFSDGSGTASQGVNWVDRRPWARGAFIKLVRNSNAIGGNDYSTNSGAAVPIDSANLSVRVECSGLPIRMSLTCRVYDAPYKLWPLVDGAVPDGGGTTDSPFGAASNTEIINSPQYVVIPSAGSHLLQWGWSAQSGTVIMYARSSIPVTMTVEEILKANSNNGTV